MNIGDEIFWIRPNFHFLTTNPRARKYGYKNVHMMYSTVFHRETDYQTLDYAKNEKLFPEHQPEPFHNPPPIFEFFGYKELIQDRDYLCNDLGFLIVTQRFVNVLYHLNFYQYRLYPTRIYFIDHRAKRMTRKKDFVASDFEATDDYFILQLTNPIFPLWTVDTVDGRTINHILPQYLNTELPPIIHQAGDGFFCTRRAFNALFEYKIGGLSLISRNRVLNAQGLLSEFEDYQKEWHDI
jgi:hypothetical protein